MAEPCMLLLAREADPAVPLLRARAPGRVRHVSPADLSRPGWRYVAGEPQAARVVAEGEVLASGDVAAIVCRIPLLLHQDLPQIHSADRAYVAAEMNAFLLAWLSQFRGPRINPPSAISLCGPGWHPMKWARVAAGAGLPVAEVRRETRRCEPSVVPLVPRTAVEVTVVGDAVFGTASPELIDAARRLAAASGLALLGMRFVRMSGSWCFAAADACPALDERTASALIRMVQDQDERGRRRCA